MNSEDASGGQSLIRSADVVLEKLLDHFAHTLNHSTWERAKGGFLMVGFYPMETVVSASHVGEIRGDWAVDSMQEASVNYRILLKRPDDLAHGGAIRVGNYIYSFAGLSDLANQAIALAIALKTGRFSVAELDTVGERNPFWEEVKQVLA